MEKDIYKQFKALKECFVSHAEMEYLWDPEGKDTGFIDPNALSAGGFPFVFRTLLEEITLSNDISVENEKVLTSGIAAAFPVLARKEVEILRGSIKAVLSHMGLSTEANISDFVFGLKNKAPYLVKLYQKEFFTRLKTLLSTDHGIAWIVPTFWKQYRINKIEVFKKAADNGESISFFSEKVVKEVKRYLDNLVTTLKDVQGPVYTTYDVEWESDFSYYLASEKQTNEVTVRVLSDLHANTGLFSEIPLKAILAPFGSTQFVEVYKLLVNPQDVGKAEGHYHLSNSKCVIDIIEHGEKKIILPNKEVVDVSDSVVTVKESETPHFKQYAYLWEWYDKSQFDLENESHRKMYLSSLLNAKSAYFELLKKCKHEYGTKVSFPKTSVIGTNVTPRKEEFAETITLKDGGWCSTGGKHVHRINKSELSSMCMALPYEGFVVQNYTPSLLFEQGAEVPFHGHVRKASIIDRKGNISHAGFVLKLIEQEKGNSSGYRSHMMYFAEDGSFVFGKEIGGSSKLYTSLKEAGFKAKVKMQEVLDSAKSEWEQAMYAINKFIKEKDIKEFTGKLVESGKLSARYNIR